jgi:hypothetical protein
MDVLLSFPLPNLLKALLPLLHQDGPKLAMTHSCTRRIYSARSSVKSLLASELAGELGLGSESSDWMDCSTAATL